jgi:hypothetical protein
MRDRTGLVDSFLFYFIAAWRLCCNQMFALQQSQDERVNN